MKLEDVVPKYKIFLDVDGVMADFYKWAEETIGEHPKDEKEFWDKVKHYANEHSDKPIWGCLELTPDAMELWDYVKKYNPVFLTSTGTWKPDKADKEKREWLHKHFPGVDVITVRTSKLKAECADEKSILIDDRIKSVWPWREAGGIGILHKNAKETIEQLKEFGL